MISHKTIILEILFQTIQFLVKSNTFLKERENDFGGFWILGVEMGEIGDYSGQALFASGASAKFGTLVVSVKFTPLPPVRGQPGEGVSKWEGWSRVGEGGGGGSELGRTGYGFDNQGFLSFIMSHGGEMWNQSPKSDDFWRKYTLKYAKFSRSFRSRK